MGECSTPKDNSTYAEACRASPLLRSLTHFQGREVHGAVREDTWDSSIGAANGDDHMRDVRLQSLWSQTGRSAASVRCRGNAGSRYRVTRSGSWVTRSWLQTVEFHREKWQLFCRIALTSTDTQHAIASSFSFNVDRELIARLRAMDVRNVRAPSSPVPEFSRGVGRHLTTTHE